LSHTTTADSIGEHPDSPSQEAEIASILGMHRPLQARPASFAPVDIVAGL
jgi:hypothetical protein